MGCEPERGGGRPPLHERDGRGVRAELLKADVVGTLLVHPNAADRR